MKRDLTRLLRPKSIAVFGGAWAENVVAQCVTSGFAGEIWPVHPSRSEIGGRPCFRSVADLPGAPDAAFIGVNRHATLDVLEALAAAGCGGAICFASGFAETGEQALQDAFVACAGAMPVLGPNCYGVLNCLDGAMIWPDQQGCLPVNSGVAILTQSSNIGMSLTMQRRGLPIAYLACLGNAAQTGLAELAEAMLADPRVTALGVYMEGVGNAAAFAQVVARAREAGKGVIVLKAGKSDSGRAVALTHTASLAGGGAASSAFLRQIGAGEVRSLPELIEALKILHVNGPLAVRSLISVSCSGGEAGLVADAAMGGSLVFPVIPKAQATRLTALLGPLVTISNPLDYHTFIWGDGALMGQVFTEAASGFDAGLFVIDQPRGDRCDTSSFDPAYGAIIETARATGRPVFAVSSVPETMDESLSHRLMASGVTPLLGIDHALGAIEAANVAKGEAGWGPVEVAQFGAGPGVVLDEAQAKELLRGAGVEVPRGVVARDIAGLDVTVLSGPFALKGLGFAHKSEAAAVRLNIDEPMLEPAMAGAQGYLLEEMVTSVVAEVLIGVARDPVYGVAVTLGSGGVLAELLEDSVTLIAPVSGAQIEAALERLKIWTLLVGYRGAAGADVAVIVRAVLAVQALILRDATLIDIEINPLMVREHGAVAADALIRRDTI